MIAVANATRKRKGGGTGNFAYVLAIHLNLAARRRQHTLNVEAGKLAPYLSAGPNALPDLLADVAAFDDIQCAFWLSLLRQIAFPDVKAIARNSRCNSQQLDGRRANRLRSRPNQAFVGGAMIFSGYPEFK